MLKHLKGVGPKTIIELNNEGIYSVNDLIYRFPKDYLIFEHNPLGLLESKDVYLEGIVDSTISYFKYRNNVFAFSFYLKYDNVRLKMSIFSNIYVGLKIKQGDFIGVYGKYNKIKNNFSIKRLFLDNLGNKIEPDYKMKNINNNRISKIIEGALLNIDNYEETLPLELINKYRLLNIKDYIYLSHFPKNKNDVNEVLRRRKYEEFYWYSLSLSYIRYNRVANKKEKRNINLELYNEIKNKLDYELTIDQEKAISDIIGDFNSPYPMNRLVQGDVGCGKTIVGIIAALLMTKANFQVAWLSPTEVLARQSFEEINKLLNGYNLNIKLLTGSVKNLEYDEIINDLSNGKINIIVGTHSLLYDKVIFNKLGLVIIDEQHRFGVNQRLKLVNKYKDVDSLFFSATPIPRTLGLTFLKNLDITSIKAMPKGRKKVITKIITFDKINSLFTSIKNHLNNNEKAYVVVPLIENIDDVDYIDIYECEKMFKNKFKNVNIGILHGKMNTIEKNNIIDEFKNGDMKILISTTVIEVGVNVPSATMMIIMNADRFGLSTLHQLRGRVGRGNLDSYCMLVSNEEDNDRLKALCDVSDGFEIAEIDFKLRGPGNYLGEEQSGYHSLRYASFDNDIKILECARDDSTRLISSYVNGTIKSKKYDEIIAQSEIDKIN